MNLAFSQLCTKYPTLPGGYVDFLERSGGLEGELAVEPGWFQIWSAQEVLVASERYGLAEFLPGYFAFGSNGGGELFVFPLAEDNPTIFRVPAVGMSHEELIPVAEDFIAFSRVMSPRT